MSSASSLPPLPPPLPPPPPQDDSNETYGPQSKNNNIRSDEVKKYTSILVSYPSLIPHEERLVRTPYDVTAWMNYLDDIDGIMDDLESLAKEDHENNISTNSSKKKKTTTTTTTKQRRRSIGGRLLLLSSKEYPSVLLSELNQARWFVAERALSLLPGSYKVWHSHLIFSTTRFLFHGHRRPSNNTIITAITTTTTTTNSSTIQQKQQQTKEGSEPNEKLLRRVQWTMERSLVRMNKMPRIWLLYLAFMVRFLPWKITTIRRLFDRSLLALPATQHHLIWNDYVAYVTGSIPPHLQNNHANTNSKDSPIVTMILLGDYGIHNNNNNNHDSKQPSSSSSITTGVPFIVPVETTLCVLRRRAHYFDPSAREHLADLCVSHHRFGEAATLYSQILNDVDFVSPLGSTRHDLWMRLADLCTQHPRHVSRAGIDFEAIVRAALRGDLRDHDEDDEGGGLGWKVFDLTADIQQKNNNSDNNDKVKNDSNDNMDSSSDSQQQRTKALDKDASSQKQLQANLGEMEGTLWTKLAEYRVRSGEFESARSIYEEAMESVSRVRDFSLVFDSYMRFEEGVVEAMMELMEEDDENENDHEQDNTKTNGHHHDDDDDMDILLGDITSRNNNNTITDEEEPSGTSADVDLALARAENLTGRRPLLLNRVLLRQNPNNVGEWMKRSQLYQKRDHPRFSPKAVSALEEAIRTVDAKRAVNGMPSLLFTTLASIHENNDNTEKNSGIDAARRVYERACVEYIYDFHNVDDLAQLHAAWVELELRVENWDGALTVARRSVAPPDSSQKHQNSQKKNDNNDDDDNPHRGRHHHRGPIRRVQRELTKSLRLWNLLLDLEESLGTVRTTKDAYNRAIELRVATVSHILNFASFLKERKYYEESFTAYERGVDLFAFPHEGASTLWKAYLNAFLDRYNDGSKIHRARELFDRCLAHCPADASSEFFILYGDLEERHGLTKRALGVYEKMCTVVPNDDKFVAYQLYIAKASRYLGVSATRGVYERAIAALEDAPAARMCLEYGRVETDLGELDRARTVLTYGAQLADPRRHPEYWASWHDFEVSHGNEETFREMLRVKRAVQAKFSTVNYNAAEMGAGVPKVEALSDEAALDMIAAREGVDAKVQPRIGGFVQGKRTAEITDLGEVERRAAKLRKKTSATETTTTISDDPGSNDNVVSHEDGDEIDIDDDDDDDNDVTKLTGDDDDAAQGTSTDENVTDVSTKGVPAAVFGHLAKVVSSNQ